jgi:hypothetical protein
MIEVPLTQGKVALIDDEDAERVLRYEWRAAWHAGARRYYVKRRTRRKGGPRHIWLHRFILDAPPGVEVDHINRDGLDNRRANLRFATPAENQWNSGRRIDNRTGFKGVYWNKRKKQFRAQIKRHGVQRCIGDFTTAIEAARAYDAAARLLFGEFARVNFPNEVHQLDPQVATHLINRDSPDWMPARPLRGAANGRARLTDEQVEEIRKAHASGSGYKQLEASYGVSRLTIYRILAGKTYRLNEEKAR